MADQLRASKAAEPDQPSKSDRVSVAGSGRWRVARLRVGHCIWLRILTRPVLASLIAVVGVATTALWALVIEDMWPNPANAQPTSTTFSWTQSTAPRIFAAIAALVVLVLLLWAATVRRKRVGSFFYIRLGHRGWQDLHGLFASGKGRRREVFRSVLGRLEGRRTPTETSSGWADDYSESIENYVDRVVEALHSDDLATATTVAPNMPYTAALAVGSLWNPPPNIAIAEINATPAAIGERAPRNEFTLDVRDADAEYAAMVKRDRSGEFDRLRTELITDLDGTLQGSLIWIDVYATKPQDPRAAQLAASLVLAGETRANRRRLVGQVDTRAGQPSTTTTTKSLVVCSRPNEVTVGRQHQPQPEEVRLLPAQLAALLAWSIHDAHRQAPEATIVLTARMPKAIALAVGALLKPSNRLCRDVHVRDGKTVACPAIRGYPWPFLRPLEYKPPGWTQARLTSTQV